MPGLVGSMVLLIIGAIAKYAYSDKVWTWTSSGEQHSLQVETIGTILLIAGLVALFVSILYAFIGRERHVRDEPVYVEPEPVVVPKRRRAVTVEKNVDMVPPVKAPRSRKRKTD